MVGIDDEPIFIIVTCNTEAVGTANRSGGLLVASASGLQPELDTHISMSSSISPIMASERALTSRTCSLPS